MTLYRLIIRSLVYYKRINITVLIGALVSAAILTGGLIIGDSIKYSLKQISYKRLGNTQFAITAGERFFGQDLSDKLSARFDVSTSSAILINGIAINNDVDKRINNAQVVGIDHRFWKLHDSQLPELGEDEAIINRKTAEKLNLKTGDEFLLRAEKPGLIPLNAPFVSDENTSLSLRLTVKYITDNEIPGDFSLQSNQIAPFNVFVSIQQLSEKLDLQNYANVILLSDNKDLTQDDIQNSIHELWSLKDANLKLMADDSLNIFELTSERIFIEDAVADVVKSLDVNPNFILTYFVNSFSYDNRSTPYSFVSASGLPIVPSDLKDDEIIINSWLANDLEVKTGDTINLKYFVTAPMRQLREDSKVFIIRQILNIDSLAKFENLMPDFPGLSDAGNCRDWETGVPINFEQIRDKDEAYWDIYKGLPKAFINKTIATTMWENRFGTYTSVWFAKDEHNRNDLSNRILQKLQPSDLGIIALNVKAEGNSAASNSVDFGELFLSLSFFILAAAVLLTVLLFSLNIQYRTQETGILLGIGYNRMQIRNLLLAEGAVLSIVGSVVGGIAGIFYNDIILLALEAVWQDAVRTTMLQSYVQPSTVATGIIFTVLIAFLSIFVSLKNKFGQEIANLQKKSFLLKEKKKRTVVINIVFAVFFIALSITMISFTGFTPEQRNVSLFMGAGATLLIGSLLFVNILIIQFSRIKHNRLNLFKLSIKNAGLKHKRSISIVILIAIGTFSVILTGANRKDLLSDAEMRSSGTGGFLFWCESSIPVLHDLNTPEGKAATGLDAENFKELDFVQFRTLDGGDASCLNLNQIQRPRIMGVNPYDLQKRKAFSFAALLPEINPDNVWMSLNKPLDDNTIPAIADQTVIIWGLGKSVGDTLKYTDEKGQIINLKLIAGLSNSVFQGNIIISDSLFIQNFPSVSGSQLMLIDGEFGKAQETEQELFGTFRDYGMEISYTSKRLAEFNSIENTYLSIFLLLGGFGIIIGVIGLGIVLARNILERKNEFVLLQAIGYQRRIIVRMLITENIFLLILGILTGVLSAFVGTIHVFLSSNIDVPWNIILLIIAGIFANGMFWI